MNSHLAVLASLGVAILLSPEILVLGLIMACDKRAPRLAAWMYALGAAAGVAFGLVLGFLIAPSAPTESAPASPTWTAFWVRVMIAGVLVGIGVQRTMHAMRAAPISGVDEGANGHAAGHGLTARMKAWIAARFPGLASGELPAWRRSIRSALLGFATMGVHPKCVSVAIAAGHQALQIPDRAGQVAGIAVFAAISMVPAVAPAIIETAKPGASAAIKDACERFMKKQGRWISAVILLGAGAYVAWNAWADMP